MREKQNASERAADGSTLARRTSQIIFVINLLMLLAAVALGIRFAAPYRLENWVWILLFRSLNSILYGVLAILIIHRHARHTVGWLFLAVSFFLAVAQLQSGATAMALSLPIQSQLIKSIITLVGHMAWVPWLLIPISLVVQFFPNGRLPSRRWWPITAVTILAMICMEVWQTFIPWDAEMQSDLGAPNSWATPGSTEIFERVEQVSIILFAVSVIGTWLMVVVRYHRSHQAEREQMRWMIYSVGIIITLLVLFFAFPNLPFVNGLINGNTVNPLVSFILPILFPLGLSIAILRHNLWDIDVVINRTLVYGLLTVIIVSLYIIIVSGLGVLFHTQTNAVGGLVATAVIAVLFQPLRTSLQRAANRLLYGERDDPTAVLTQLAQQLESANTPGDILPNLVNTIAQTLKLPHVAIWLPDDDGNFALAAHYGQSPDHVEMIPLTYYTQTIGQLVVAPRHGNGRFDKQDQRLLTSIAANTANTVRAVQLSNELRQSRQRIVTAREEERRRLRRDLHDGLGPQLASQMLSLEAVQHLLATDPQKASELLDSLKAQAQEAITDVRHLVYELRPPALDDLGLAGALKQGAARLECNGLQFELDMPEPVLELPAAVETAVYRIAQEALTNIVRHAQATHATIRLTYTSQQLCLAICDNGCGLSSEAESGVGLQSMRERAAELNGSCVIGSQPEGGTKVEVQLPLEMPDA